MMKKMKSGSTFLLLVLLTSSVFGQIETQIDSLFEEYNDQPGCAIAVYGKGKILFEKGYGIANLDYDIKITPTTVFDIGSVSKQFTAACIVLLENEGKLSLDDPISKYIPEIPEYDAGEITIRHLLHHTSGLRDYLTLMYLSGISYDNYFTEEDGLEILKMQNELNFKPGSEYLYSNSGYLLLAIIIRRVSGMSIGSYAQQKIFEPLEMKNTFIYEDGGKVVKNRAIGYSKEGDEYKREHHFDFVCGGDGQVYTTVEDFFKWSENFKSSKIGNDTFIDQMLVKGLLNNGDTLDYTLGLFHGTYKGLKTISHGGSWGGFRAHYLQFPDEDLSVAVMSNAGDFNAEQGANQLAELFLENKLKADEIPEWKLKKTETKPIKLSTKKLEKFCASYWNNEGSYSRKIHIKNDTLRYYRSENSESSLVPINQNEFIMLEVNSDVKVKFLISKNNQHRMIVTIDDEDPIESVAYEPVFYSTEELMTFVGSYYSDELNVVYDLMMKDDKLMLYLKGKVISEMHAIMDNIFSNDDFGVFEFMEDSNGSIKEFELMAGRVKNLKFIKQ